MFGEDSESPRVPSPWDSFLPSPPSETCSLEARKQLRSGIPKLAPEVEEGNVEYKLKLTDISPARFARLVTQLKWRLLEGSGQAYYELGVADSGALIGLSRSDLEQSLETLEMMAGEIGASVIVVKEIEVPPAMVALADKVSAYIDPETGKWTEKMNNKRYRASPSAGGSSTPYSSGGDTEAEIDDLADSDETFSTLSTPDFPPESDIRAAAVTPYVHRLATSNPSRPVAQSSPSIYPIDDDLALFSMEPEPSMDDDDLGTEELVPDVHEDVPDLSLDIEITPVYKPRPVRRRVHLVPGPVAAVARLPRRAHKNKNKKQQQPWHTLPPLSSDIVTIDSPSPAAAIEEVDKALQKRITRDKRREEKRKAIIALAGSGVAAVAGPLDVVPTQIAIGEFPTTAAIDPVCAVVDDLRALHVKVQSAAVNNVVDGDALAVKGVEVLTSITADVEGPSFVGHAKTLAEAKVPRLIVEALVVRKMSLEEGYLDLNLSGFSLT